MLGKSPFPMTNLPAKNGLRAALLLGASLLACQTNAAELQNIAEDDARNGAYGGGWADQSQGGHGFGPWTLRTEQGAENSFSGSFTANPQANPDLAPAISAGGKAWGLFANGSIFEQSVAFRAFSTPLAADTTFSLLMDHGDVRSGSHPGQASCGVVLRSGTRADAPADYNADARLEVLALDGKANYQIVDAAGIADTGVPLTKSGLLLTFTPRAGDLCDVELKALPDGKVVRLDGRKLAGASGAPLASVALYSRDCEGGDVFFNGLQITRAAKR